jgi:hypothetical protein
MTQKRRGTLPVSGLPRSYEACCALFHRPSQESLAQGVSGGSSISVSEVCRPSGIPRKTLIALVMSFFELRSCLIEEGFVLRFWLGDPHLQIVSFGRSCTATYDHYQAQLAIFAKPVPPIQPLPS